jgi:hypothetical protein
VEVERDRMKAREKGSKREEEKEVDMIDID